MPGMVVRRTLLVLWLLLLAGVHRADAAAQRVISMNPSLTAILVALDAREVLVGIDDFSARQQPEVSDLPRVGGLYNPSLEAVVALDPDLVVLIPSVEQRDFRVQLEDLGIAVSVFENIRFDQVLENIERLGRLVGREAEAAERISAIQTTRRAVARIAAGRPAPKALLVVQRDPIFVAGGGSFIDEMLEAAGARNLGARYRDPYPRVAVEWVVSAAPEVLLDMSPDADDAAEYWSRWPSIPAVTQGRVLRLEQMVTLPGPYLDRSLERLATAIHGVEISSGISPESAGPLP
jgi:iron complex transport system substrate-binding protein